MSRRNGTVVQIKGRFYARWTVDGHRVYGSPHNSFEAADKERTNSPPARKPKLTKTASPTLNEWAQACLTGDYGRGIASTTFDLSETIRINWIEPCDLGKKRLHRITKSDCRAWVSSIPKSAAYVRRCAAFVSKLFSMAVEAEILISNPMKGVKLPEVSERDNRTLSPSEAMRLLNPSTRTDAIMLVAMYTGMRRSEIVRLRWTDVGSDFIKVPGTKTAKSKSRVPMPDEVRAAIENQPRTGEYVFSTASGKPISARNITRDVSRRKQELGLPSEMRLQDLRGSYVSLLIEQGADPRTVMDLARHSDLRTTMKAYARSREQVRQDAVQKLSDSIRNSTDNPEVESRNGGTQ